MVSQRNGRGFTLIELLVVIAIIAILAAILFPVFAKAKETGRTAKCASQLRQINTGLLMYVDDSSGRFPDSSGMYYCRLLAITHGVAAWNQAKGPYALDLLAKYVRNNASVWLCPSLSPMRVVPDYSGWSVHDISGSPFTWMQNKGGESQNNYASSYLWIHDRVRKNGYAHDSTTRISGSQASAIKRNTRAMTFMEMPYWVADDQLPHKIAGSGINVVFYDGHVKMERNAVHAFLNLSWQGWEL